MRYDLCVVIPAYNESYAIAETIRDYKSAFPGAIIVIVDNNSNDGTDKVAEAALESRDILLHERHQGKGSAVKAGLSRVAAKIYILVDGDMTYPAREASRLMQILKDRRCDMVVGDRISGGAYHRQHSRAGHSAGNIFLSRFVSFLAGQRYADVLSGLRVMSRPFVNMLDVRSSGFQLETELNVIAAYVRADVIEEPIEYLGRPEGSHSKLNTISDGFKIMCFALLNWIFFFPLQPFGMLAGVAFIFSGLLGVRVFQIFLETGLMPYQSSAIAAAAAGMVALQAIFSGLILRILTRANRRRDVANLMDMKREWNNSLDNEEPGSTPLESR